MGKKINVKFGLLMLLIFLCIISFTCNDFIVQSSDTNNNILHYRKQNIYKTAAFDCAIEDHSERRSIRNQQTNGNKIANSVIESFEDKFNHLDNARNNKYPNENPDFQALDQHPSQQGSLIGTFVGLAAVSIVAFVVIWTSERRRKYQK
jgi:hypothetical protein